MTGHMITFPVRLYARGARMLIHVAEDVTGKAVMGTLRVAGALGDLRGGHEHSAPPARTPSPAPAARRPAPEAPETPSRARGPRETTRPTTPRSRNGSASPARGPQPPTPQPPTPQAPAAEAARPEAPGAEAPRPEVPSAEAPLASERLEQEGVVASVDLDAPAPAAPEHVSSEPVLVREESEAGAEDGAGATISVQEPWPGYARMTARDIVARLSAGSSAELTAVALYENSHRKRQTILTAVRRELAQPGR